MLCIYADKYSKICFNTDKKSLNWIRFNYSASEPN